MAKCKCKDPDKCRVCVMRKAHEFRLAGDEKKFETWMAMACRLLDNERLRR